MALMFQLFFIVILLCKACSFTRTEFVHPYTVMGPSFPTVSANETKMSDQEEVDILPQHYFREVAPILNGKPVKVSVSVVVLKLSQSSTQTFDADIFYHSYWTDHRLQKPSNEDSITQRINLSTNESLVQYKLSYTWRDRLWTPDIFFRNAIKGKIASVATPTYYFTITNHTEVFMAVRLSLKLYCDMNLAQFPFDTQTCFLNISMTYDDVHTVVLEWDTFRVDNRVEMTEFEVISVGQKSCVKYTDIGAILSCLYGEVRLKRISGNYLLKRFIPSFIIVLTTFASFWIPTTLFSSRTSLPITALLALITQQIKSDLDVSYVYALQVWNIVCIMFVFANLFEYLLSIYVMYMSMKNNAGQDNRGSDAPTIAKNGKNNGTLEMSLSESSNTRQKVSLCWICLWRMMKHGLYSHFQTTSRHSSVDYISRYLFPIAYSVFVITFIRYCS